jgi:hypothetical protein
MLGRFRMTIDDCLEEYERMSQCIFGKPRLLSQRNTGLPWPKYNARGIEDALQEVSLRRCEQPVGKHVSVTPMFPNKTDATCQTSVCPRTEAPVVFRSNRLTQQQLCHDIPQDQERRGCRRRGLLPHPLLYSREESHTGQIQATTPSSLVPIKRYAHCQLWTSGANGCPTGRPSRYRSTSVF